MKSLVLLFAVLALALTFGMVGTPVFAQTHVYENSPYPPPENPTLNPAYNYPSGPEYYNYNPAYTNVAYNQDLQYRADKIIGKHVYDQQGDKVGKIKDLLLDPNGRVAFAVMKPSYHMGFGMGRYIALPMSALSWNGANRDFVLNIPRDRLAQAPTFDKHNWPNLADRAWMSSVYQFYGITPYWNAE